MKPIRSYLWLASLPLAALLLTALPSCKKNFFNLSPTAALSPATFWKDQNDALSAVASCYNSLTNVNEEVLPYLDVLTPNAHSEYPWEGWEVINQGGMTPVNTGTPGSIWSGAYGGIGRCNTVLANISKPVMDDSLRARIKGEALFLRAYYYSILADFWGGVPLITLPPDLTQATQPRSTKDSVIAQVLSDLTGAAAVLPLSYNGSDIGRATKGAALALQTRVLLYNKSWTAAAAAAQNVMALNQYQLFPSYRGLFLPQNENNTEVIFDVQYKDPEYYSNWDTYLGFYNGAFTPGWSSIEPTTDFVDEYEMKDGSTWSQANPVADPADKYNNRDPRMDQTIFRKGKMYNGVPYPVDANGYAGDFTGFSYKKYTVYDSAAGPMIQYNHSYINGIVLRHADVLLMYAEAQNEAIGPDATVYSAINSVRARAGMPGLSAGLSQSQMRDKIRHERRIEFVGEGLYFSDVRRWGIAGDVLNRAIQLNGPSYKGKMEIRTFNAWDTVWAITQSEIDNSKNAIKQNPGY